MTNAANIDDSVVAKIQKLLEMAARAHGNENEAAVAMGKAQELLAKYNLDLATVQDKQVKGSPNKQADEKRGYQKVSRSAMYEWQRELVGVIGETNFCIVWITTEFEPYRKRGQDWDSHRKVKRYKILGREGNTMSVLLMVDYLFETIERLLPYENKDRLSRSAISWRQGCADRLKHRLWNKYQEMRKADYATQGEEGYTTALALVRVDKAEEIANYDFRFGKGAWAQKEENNRIYEEGRAAREAKKLEAQKQKELELANETPAQRRAREIEEAKEARANQRYWNKYAREQQEKANRVDQHAYARGAEVGSSISLDSQLDKGGSNRGSLG